MEISIRSHTLIVLAHRLSDGVDSYNDLKKDSSSIDKREVFKVMNDLEREITQTKLALIEHVMINYVTLTRT